MGSHSPSADGLAALRICKNTADGGYSLAITVSRTSEAELPEPSTEEHGRMAMRMSERALTTPALPSGLWALTALFVLDLSRNRLTELPDAVGGLTLLQLLDVSRNRLLVLPKAVGRLQQLVTLSAQSNRLRPAGRSLPLAELRSLARLRLIDLRFNSKLRMQTDLIAAAVPQATALMRNPEASDNGGGGDGAAGGGSGISAEAAALLGCRSADVQPHARRARLIPADADATQLRPQLEPHCTGLLRTRLIETFGRSPAETDPDHVSRSQIMQTLLDCYAVDGPRAVCTPPRNPNSAHHSSYKIPGVVC